MGAVVLGLGASACAVVGPLYDRGMADAPTRACVTVAPGAAGLGAAGPGAGLGAQCFALAQVGSDGQRGAWAGGPLAPGRSLLAVHRTGPGCSGTFTHLIVDGASQGAGRAQLATWDVHGRAGHSRELRWREGFDDRSFALADIGSALMNPGGARISVSQGSLDVRQICFASY